MKIRLLMRSVITIIFYLGSANIFAKNDKVLILVNAFNKPEFIELQAKCFKKFVKDDYEFVIFNDAIKKELSNQIIDTCTKLNIRCIRTPQYIHEYLYSPSHCSADSIKYALDTIGFNHHGTVAIMHADMFLIKPFSFNNFIKDNDIAGWLLKVNEKPLIRYFWDGLLVMNMKTLPKKETMNFNPGSIHGVFVDTCGHLHDYLNENPKLKYTLYDIVYNFDMLPKTAAELAKFNFDKTTIEFIMKSQQTGDPYQPELHADFSFLHYRGGSNWINQPANYHQDKAKRLNDFMAYILG